MTAVPLPAPLTATSTVVPRAAPAGPGARADGSVLLETTSPLPSGTQVQARVRERYALFDGASAVPPPFTQDLVLYAQPPRGLAPSLHATFPITPSLQFDILTLQRGTVHLEVTAPTAVLGGHVVGAAGGSLTDANGNTLLVPSAALTAETVLDLLPLLAAELLLPVPTTFSLLGAVQVGLSGVTLAHSATLTLALPTPLPSGAQVLVAQVIADPTDVRYLRLVALGQVQGNRVVSQTRVGTVTLPGITTGGQYVFVQPNIPLGFIAGTIVAPDGSTPQAQVLVTADTAPFVDLTSSQGTYVLAAQSGVDTQVTATDVLTRNTASSVVHLAQPDEVARLDLTLQSVLPTVVRTTPGANAVDVAPNTPIVVQFSTPMDANSVTPSSVVLQQGGTVVSGQRTLAADGRSVTLRPDVDLPSNTRYTLMLTAAVRDTAGHALVPLSLSFTTRDTSKPPQPPAGQITAALPDAERIVLIFGTQGTAEPGSGVTVTRLRTQETLTVLALEDGSFRLRLPAEVGDELTLTFRNAAGQDVTTAITQFTDPDGTTGLGLQGGTITGPGGRVAHILPRALRVPAVVKLDAPGDAATFPSLPPDFGYVDTMRLTIPSEVLNRVTTLTLAESQHRFAPQTTSIAPLLATGSLVVPADFLVNGQLRFTATAEDAGGNRHSTTGATLVVAANPVVDTLETAFTSQFPTVFLTALQEALPNQQVQVQASAPGARVEFTLPAPAALTPQAQLLLARLTSSNGEAGLALVDRLTVQQEANTTVMRTTGRDLPGATLTGQYSVLVSTLPLATVTGRITGPAVTVRVQDTPFIVETNSPNASFRVPVHAGQPFTLAFLDPVTGQIRGTASAQAPDSGELDLGEPLSPAAGGLQVRAEPDTNALVDINQPVMLTFSEPIDSRTVHAGILVTDLAGNRIFGKLTVSADTTQVTFTPSRRWRFGTTYRYGVARSVQALSGARLSSPFTGQFTTFTPRLLGQTTVDGTRDVAVAGHLALLGSASGFSVFDLTQAEAPGLLAQTAVPGGVSGVSLLSSVSFTDRQGQSRMGVLGLVAGGNRTTPGIFQVLDLNTPTTPLLLGAAQLTVPPGQTPPANVPNMPGTPAAVALGPGQQAVVAVQALGVETVRLSQVIPHDPANPGAALGPRFPSTGVESVNHLAILDDKIVAVGSQGLTILDGTSLQPLSKISTTVDAQGVAVLKNFRMDVNGDGGIDPAVEMFDLAVVANGQDGTVQSFDLRDPAQPRLVSVVRLGCPALSVALDATEQLAYVGCGASGLVVVDLAGPASVQPIDVDRDSRDDRILGTVTLPGAATRLALQLSRGLGYVAAGPGGLLTLQLLPPRTRFEAVVRDPVAAATGDEQSMLETHTAFTTDDALLVTVQAAIPPQTGLFLAIEEVPMAGGPALLRFADGTTSTPLAEGTQTLEITIHPTQPTHQSRGTLTVQDQAGRAVHRFAFQLVPAEAGTARLQSVFLAPQRVVMPATVQTAQLSVGGVFSDGRIFNLTTAVTGTTYSVDTPEVATLDGAGLITARAGGDNRRFCRQSRGAEFCAG